MSGKEKRGKTQKLKERIEQTRNLQQAVLAAGCVTLCRETSWAARPWLWASAASIRRFYIQDPAFKSEHALAPGTARALRYACAFSCLFMTLVWTAPHKFEAAFPAWLIGLLGVAASLLAHYVFVDFNLLQMSALTLASCHTLAPHLDKDKKERREKLVRIRESFFPRAVSRPVYLLISAGLALFIPYMFPPVGYLSLMTGGGWPAALQATAIAFDCGLLLALVWVFGVPVARFTNEDPESPALWDFIRRSAHALDSLGATVSPDGKEEKTE